MAGTSESLSTFMTSITGAMGDFSVGNLVLILTAALGVTVSLAIAWFAYRFIKRKVVRAMMNGSI